MSFSLADRTQAINNKTEITNGSVGCSADVVHICTSKSFVPSTGADTQKICVDEMSLTGQKVRSFVGQSELDRTENQKLCVDEMSLIGQKVRSFVGQGELDRTEGQKLCWTR